MLLEYEQDTLTQNSPIDHSCFKHKSCSYTSYCSSLEGGWRVEKRTLAHEFLHDVRNGILHPTYLRVHFKLSALVDIISPPSALSGRSHYSYKVEA